LFSKHNACACRVEIVKRSEEKKIPNFFNFSQTMLRIKDPKKSIPFYAALGMTVVRAKDYGDFSNYFLASSSSIDPSIDYSKLSDDDAKTVLSMMFGPILELTHNHGTEAQEDFKHYNGNEEGRQGFGHIAFVVDDVYAACDNIREMGYGFRKEADGGNMKGLAFAFDPDGYSVEIIKRGGMDLGDTRVASP
jgi:lactoylglutathione lyase